MIIEYEFQIKFTDKSQKPHKVRGKDPGACRQIFYLATGNNQVSSHKNKYINKLFLKNLLLLLLQDVQAQEAARPSRGPADEGKKDDIIPQNCW